MRSTEAKMPAGHWFDVRGEYQKLGRRRMGFAVIREILLRFVTFGFGVGELDPKRFCDVIVLRRDNGDVVAMYSYDRSGDASAHLESLQHRLVDQDVYDFCRELGIATDLVEGPGSDDKVDQDIAWVDISRSERRRIS